jgi:predicted P-loop ATPase
MTISPANPSTLLVQGYQGKSDRASIPTLWVDSIDGLPVERLAQHFQLLTPNDETEPGHHIVALSSEQAIRKQIRRIRGLAEEIRIFPSDLLPFELPIQIAIRAQPLEYWQKSLQDEPLELEKAHALAEDILRDANITPSQREIELDGLRQRWNKSGEYSLNTRWNKFITNLEREIHAAVNSRQSQGVSDTDTRRSKFSRRYEAVKGLWDGRLRFNTLKQQAELDGEPLDLDFVRADLCLELNIDIPKEEAVEIVLRIARENQYCPIVEYLEKAEAAYPEPNINFTHLTSLLLGTSNPLHVAYLKRHLIGSVARAMKPGCKMDTALILQGNQGIGKSSLFRALYGDEFFDDTMAEASDKDELMKLHQHWAVEWAEFETQLSRKGYSRLKQFMSTKVDNYRAPYARTSKSFLRRSILVGSTNELEFLNDPSGDRRYWIIPVSTIDVASAERLRDQIWAAAVQAYRSGEQWWLTGEEKQLADEANKPFRLSDTWEDFIFSYVRCREFVTIAEVLTQALKIESSKQDKGSQMRASAILRRLGWDKGKAWVGGTWKRVWINPDFDRSTDPPFDEVDRSNSKVDRCQKLNEIKASGYTDPPDPPFDQHSPENHLGLEQVGKETRESLEKGGSVEQDETAEPCEIRVSPTDPPSERKEEIQSVTVGQWVRLSQNMQPMDAGRVVRIIRERNEHGFYLGSGQGSPDYEKGVPFYGSLRDCDFEPLSKAERCQLGLSPSGNPYSSKRLPKKGDRLRTVYGTEGKVTVVRATNPRYEISWDNGRVMGYELADLEALEARKI